jgi:ATP-binding cassette subfamily B protein
VQLVNAKSDPKDRREQAFTPQAEREVKRASLKPLLALKPNLLRHKGMLAAAFAALLVSAGATLAVPMAVRRMIDLGFSGIEPDLIDKYFATLGSASA